MGIFKKYISYTTWKSVNSLIEKTFDIVREKCAKELLAYRRALSLKGKKNPLANLLLENCVNKNEDWHVKCVVQKKALTQCSEDKYV